MTRKKPTHKEYWLDHDCYYMQSEIIASSSTAYPINPVNLIHVIEYSALTKALSALEKCLPLLDACDGPIWNDAKVEVTAAIDELRGVRG